MRQFFSFVTFIISASSVYAVELLIKDYVLNLNFPFKVTAVLVCIFAVLDALIAVPVTIFVVALLP